MREIFSRFRIAVALGVAIFLVSGTRGRLGKQDFQLVNKTGVEIHELYVSPHDSSDWQEDVLGHETLADGETVKVTFDDREKHDKWNLKVVDGKGNSIEWNNLELTKISELVLYYKDGKAWADVK